MHLSSRREQDSNNFQFYSPINFTCNEEVFIQHTKNNKFKNGKETSIEVQSESHALTQNK